MRWLRITACILGLWAFSALLFRELDVWAWIAQPSRRAIEARNNDRTTPLLITTAGVGALVCLALSSLIDLRRRSHRTPSDAPGAAPPGDPVSHDPARS